MLRLRSVVCNPYSKPHWSYGAQIVRRRQSGTASGCVQKLLVAWYLVAQQEPGWLLVRAWDLEAGPADSGEARNAAATRHESILLEVFRCFLVLALTARKMRSTEY